MESRNSGETSRLSTKTSFLPKADGPLSSQIPSLAIAEANKCVGVIIKQVRENFFSSVLLDYGIFSFLSGFLKLILNPS